jgi:hypothetical protein
MSYLSFLKLTSHVDAEPKCCNHRCTQQPKLCCDLCNLELNEIFQSEMETVHSLEDEVSEDGDHGEELVPTSSAASKKTKRPPKKNYEPCGHDIRLWRRLLEWQHQVYLDYWVESDSFGLSDTLVMVNEIVQDLVD